MTAETPEPTREEREAFLQETVARTRQVAGVRVSYPGGYWFHLAFAGGLNERFATAFWEECQPYRLVIAAEELSDEMARLILARTYVRSVIREWGRDEGDPPPTLGDVDAAAQFLIDDPEMFEDIEAIANDPDNYRGERREYGDPDSVRSADRGAGSAGPA